MHERIDGEQAQELRGELRRALLQLVRAGTDLGAALAGAVDLSPSELRALLALLDRPDRPAELATRLGLSRSAVTKIATRLEERSLLERAQLDGRSHVLDLAPGVRRALEARLDPVLAHLESRDDELPSPDRIRAYAEAMHHAVDAPAPDDAPRIGVGELEQLLLAADQRGVERSLRLHLAAGASTTELFGMLQHALASIGERWQDGDLTVAEEHIAQVTARSVVARIGEPGSGWRGTALVVCPEGEEHDLGAVMVGNVLDMHGWNVQLTGADTPAAAVAAQVRAGDAELLCISISLVDRLPDARRLIESVRAELADDRPITIVAGGRAFAIAQHSAEYVGADHVLTDLVSFEALLVELALPLP